jgi:hypothetical protein
MRGGAIPIIAWGVLLSVLTIGNAIWDGRWLPASQFALAAVIIFSFAVGIVIMSGRHAVQKGAPVRRPDPEAAPDASAGAVAAALSLALALFGFVFGSALIYLGAGLLALSLGRLAVELRAQRSSVQDWRRRGDR